VTAEITSSDIEQPESKGGIGSHAHHWINSVLPMRLRTILSGPYRVVQALRLKLLIPEGIQFWFTLKRLQKDKAHVYELYGKRHEEYRRLNADIEQIGALNDDEVYDLTVINEKIHQLYCQHIIAQAESYFVPIAEFRENGSDWEVARISRRWRLRREALGDLLSAVRKKQKERREAAQANLIWVTAFTGMIGALIGLMSVFCR
jgi:hypothetical protein